MADAITTKNITSVDEVQSVGNTDKVFVNDNGSFKQISVSNLMKQAPSGVTEETDPTVSEWAKQPTKPSYTADEVGALPVGTKIPAKTSDLINDSGYLTQIPEEYVTETELGQKGYVIEDDIPEKLPSPGILTFTGAVNDTYDGSANKTINIPTGGGEGGTSDYNALANKPKLNGVEIAGNKTSTDYKIVSSEQGIENNGKFLGVGVDGNVTPVDKPTYTADEVGARPDTWTPSAEDVGALPNNTEIPSKTSDLENDSGFITNSDIPEKLPNPQKIIFTGAVSAEYDGSSQQTINIPTGGGSGGTTDYNNLSNKPQLNGVTLEGNKTLDRVGVLAKNQGASNSGKYLSVGSDGNVVPADAPSGGTVDPEQIKQAVNGYLEENPPSGMTAEQEQQLNQNTTDVADLKSALEQDPPISENAKQLLITILKNVLYVSDQSQNIKNLQAEFGIAVDTYSILYELGDGISCTNSQTEINNGESYYTQIISDEGYSISSVSIKMSGIDITSDSYLDGNINIDSVNGNIEITVESIKNVITENLFNANTSVDGKYCNITDGILLPNSNYSASDYILLEKGKKYRIETYTDNSYVTSSDCVIIFTSHKEYYSYKQYSKGSGNPMLLYAEIQTDMNSYIRINLLTKYKDSTTVKEVKE